MNKLYKAWKKQLDDFDAALDGLHALEPSVRAWGSMAPALPALYDALLALLVEYAAIAGALRQWMDAHDGEDGDPVEFGKHLHAVIEASRRVKGVIDAFNREKSAAEALFPEMAAGHTLKDTAVVPMAAAEPANRATTSVPAPEKADPAALMSEASKAHQLAAASQATPRVQAEARVNQAPVNTPTVRS